MAKGRIKHLNLDKGYGFIELKSSDRDVFFHKSKLRGFQFNMLEKGMVVEYEWEKDLRGPQAVFVRVPDSTHDKNRQTHEYRFLNPYNFVRYLEVCYPEKRRPSNDVLGDCPPPPHDRYMGLTGRITCKVEAKTHLFISDSHNIQDIQLDNKKKHKIYRFFQYNGQPALPASSLRGMIRSLFETVTNSCFAEFETDEPYPLEYRLSHAPGEIVPARVLELNAEDGALLELFDCSKDAPEKISERPTVIKAGVIRMVYDPRVLKRLKRDRSIFDVSKNTIPGDLHNGMRVAALVKKRTCKKQIHKKPLYQYFEVIKVLPVDQHESLEKETNEEHAAVFGWLHLTGPNIENKHDERLFFRWDDNTPEPPQKDQIPDYCLHRCATNVVKEYNQHLSEYWERHKKTIKELGDRPWPVDKDTLPHPSNFITRGNLLKANQLEEGDLIYLIRDKGKEMLRPVAMPRIRYTYRRQDYITDNLSYCEKYSQLCPACRVFGWVHKGGKSNDLQEPVAYAGRVRFSHGEIKESKGTERELTLAILSSPKPTATEFYLLNSESKPDPQINYNDENAKLRGRKFYHHNVQATEYATDQKSDQNRTVRHALKPGAIFAFEIDFENLNQLELGALIYALELEEGMYHRLGYAKPLGFGSIKISIEIIEKFDWEERLTSVAPKAGWSTVNKDKILESKQEFLNAMRNIYGEEQFTNLQLELKAILGKQNLPIHYPRPTSQLDPNKPSFEWFVGNKKRRGKSPGPVALPVATEIQKGLPLIDKDGRPGR